MVDPAEADREYRAEAAGSALELASHAYLAVEPDLREDIAEYPLEYALDVLSYLEALQSATRAVRKQVEEYVAAQLQPATYYRHRDSIVKVGGSGAWKVKEEPVNSGALAGYIGADWPQVVNLKASGAITVTRLEALAKKLAAEMGYPDNPAAVRDAFFEYKRNENAISVIRPEDAPKYAQALPAGERYIPKPKKPAKPRLEASE